MEKKLTCLICFEFWELITEKNLSCLFGRSWITITKDVQVTVFDSEMIFMYLVSASKQQRPETRLSHTLFAAVLRANGE